MNMMADAREPTLKTQAVSAILRHEEAERALRPNNCEKIVDFESRRFTWRRAPIYGGPSAERAGPGAWAARAWQMARSGVLGDNDYDPVFQSIRRVEESPAARAAGVFRASVARGSDIFMFRQFWLRDATHINSIGLGNPLKRTCATCHNAQMTGQDLSAGWVDLGTNNYPTWTEPPLWSESRRTAGVQDHLRQIREPTASIPGPRDLYDRSRPRVDFGQVRGRGIHRHAAISRTLRAGALFCEWIGKNVARELVDFYDRRFDMKLSETEKKDLVNFLERPVTRISKGESTEYPKNRLNYRGRGAVSGCRSGPGRKLALRSSELRCLPHCARHEDRAVLSGRVQRRNLLPRHSAGHHRGVYPPQLKHEVLVEGPWRAVRECVEEFRSSR